MIWYLKDLDHKLLRHQYKLLRVFSNQWWNDEFSFIISVTQFRLVFAHLNWHRCNLLLCLINTRWTTLGNRLVRLYIYTIQHTPELSRIVNYYVPAWLDSRVTRFAWMDLETCICDIFTAKVTELTKKSFRCDKENHIFIQKIIVILTKVK